MENPLLYHADDLSTELQQVYSISRNSSFEDLRQQSLFLVLPNEVIVHIFSSLEWKDLCRIAQVCTKFNIVILQNDSTLWKKLFEKYPYNSTSTKVEEGPWILFRPKPVTITRWKIAYKQLVLGKKDKKEKKKSEPQNVDSKTEMVVEHDEPKPTGVIEIGGFRLFDAAAFKQSLEVYSKRKKGDPLPTSKGKIREILQRIPAQVKRVCVIL